MQPFVIVSFDSRLGLMARDALRKLGAKGPRFLDASVCRGEREAGTFVALAHPAAAPHQLSALKNLTGDQGGKFVMLMSDTPEAVAEEMATLMELTKPAPTPEGETKEG